jgi:hypothetical protein
MFQFSNQPNDKVGKEFYHFANKLYPYAKGRLGFEEPCTCVLVSDPENAQNPLGYTAHYNPEKSEITIFTDGRHIKDMLRSFVHELVHHAQAMRGDLGNQNTPEGYAQKDPHMREMEREAYEKGNLIFRDWEDEYKQENDMQEVYGGFGDGDFTGATDSGTGQRNVTYYTSRKMDANQEAHHQLDVLAHNDIYDYSTKPYATKFEESLKETRRRTPVSDEFKQDLISRLDLNNPSNSKRNWIGTAQMGSSELSYFWVPKNKLFYLVEFSTTYGVEIEGVYSTWYQVNSRGLKQLRRYEGQAHIETFER